MNKNTKRRNEIFRECRKEGMSQVVLQLPVSNYHSIGEKVASSMRPKTFDVAIMDKKTGIVSRNVRRNMCERVYHNTGGTATFHEPIDRSRPVIHVNHGQYNEFSYRDHHP